MFLETSKGKKKIQGAMITRWREGLKKQMKKLLGKKGNMPVNEIIRELTRKKGELGE